MTSNKSCLAFRWFFYLLGLIILALGITLNTKSSLGVSPIISVSYSVSSITNTNFGNITFLWYGIFVLVEIILHLARRVKNMKEEIIKDLLQIPLCLVFTRFMNLFSGLIPVFKEAYPDSFIGSPVGRILILIVAIALTGIGAAMSLNMRIIPNPGDGIVQGISDAWGKSVGFTKNCFDALNISITITISMLVTGHLVGVGIGTVMAVIGVGRFVALYNYLFKKKTMELSGMSSEVM